MFEYEKYVGKKISIKINDRDDLGKIDKMKTTKITGLCIFAGYNSSLDKNQITVNRMPIFEEDIVSVNIIENE
jgi:hypothetical protein